MHFCYQRSTSFFCSSHRLIISSSFSSKSDFCSLSESSYFLALSVHLNWSIISARFGVSCSSSGCSVYIDRGDISRLILSSPASSRGESPANRSNLFDSEVTHEISSSISQRGLALENGESMLSSTSKKAGVLSGRGEGVISRSPSTYYLRDVICCVNLGARSATTSLSEVQCALRPPGRLFCALTVKEAT